MTLRAIATILAAPAPEPPPPVDCSYGVSPDELEVALRRCVAQRWTPTKFNIAGRVAQRHTRLVGVRWISANAWALVLSAAIRPTDQGARLNGTFAEMRGVPMITNVVHASLALVVGLLAVSRPAFGAASIPIAALASLLSWVGGGLIIRLGRQEASRRARELAAVLQSLDVGASSEGRGPY